MSRRRPNLGEAADAGDERVVQDILERTDIRIDVNYPDKDRRTPLNRACENGHLAVVVLLLEAKGIDINKGDRSGTSPVAKAARGGYVDVVSELLKKKGDLDLKKTNRDGKQALHEACENGHHEVVKLLTTKGKCDPNVTSTPLTPLALAAKNGHHKVVEVLLAHRKIDVNVSGTDGCSPLYHACINGQTRALEQLLKFEYRPGEQGIVVNPVHEVSGRSAFFEACVSGSTDIMKILLKAHGVADAINVLDMEGWTPLIAACNARQPDVVRLLLEQPQIDPNRSKGDWTALGRACWLGDRTLLDVLINHPKIDVNGTAENGYTALHICVKQSNLNSLLTLLNHKDIDVNATNSKDGKTALQQACCQGSVQMVTHLLNNKATKYDMQDPVSGLTPLHEVCARGHTQLLKVLIRQRGINVNARDKLGRTPMWVACDRGDDNIDLVNMLLKNHKTDVNIPDNESHTPIMRVCQTGALVLLSTLIEHPDVEVNAVDEMGRNCLHLACFHGQKEMVKVLLKHCDINVNALDVEGSTALALGVECGMTNMVAVRLLALHRGIELNRADKKWRTPIYRCAEKGIAPMVEFLLQQKRLDPNRTEAEFGYTPLHIACINGFSQVISSLIKCPRIDLNKKDKEGRKPVQLDTTDTISTFLNSKDPYVTAARASASFAASAFKDAMKQRRLSSRGSVGSRGSMGSRATSRGSVFSRVGSAVMTKTKSRRISQGPPKTPLFANSMELLEDGEGLTLPPITPGGTEQKPLGQVSPTLPKSPSVREWGGELKTLDDGKLPAPIGINRVGTPKTPSQSRPGSQMERDREREAKKEANKLKTTNENLPPLSNNKPQGRASRTVRAR